MNTNRTIAVPVVALALGGAWALPAAGEPRNDNTDTVTVECEEPYGTLEITSIVRGRDGEGQGSTGWDAAGNTYVLKALAFDSRVSATLLDAAGNPAGDPGLSVDQGSGSRGSQGVAHNRDLIDCTEAGTVSEVHVIDDALAAELDAVFPTNFSWADHVGETVRIAGTFEVLFHVMVPGR